MKTKSIILALLTLVAAQSVLAAPVADRTPKSKIIVDRYYPPEPNWWRCWRAWAWLWP